jgi:CxxC motif-containing protein (DUF1111 family)
MGAQRKSAAALAAIVIIGMFSSLFAAFPNIWLFKQAQDATSSPGKLILTYKPDLSETPQGGPYLTGAKVSWINNRISQHCYSAAMEHVSANTYKYSIDAQQGDSIDYFFTQFYRGQPQDFYGWAGSHQCHCETDTKWFTYVVGVGFEPMPKWPLIVEGSHRYRNRHENEWRFDHYSGNYFQSTALNYKLYDWGDSLLVFLFPSEPTNWSNGRFCGMSGYEILCDHDTYADNRGSGDNGPPGGVFDQPTNIGGLGMTENPFQKDWTARNYNVKWYVWMLRNLSYGQYMDFELSAARTLSDGQLYYSEPQRYYIGQGFINNKFHNPWALPAGTASVNTVTFPEHGFAQGTQNFGPGMSSFFMKGKAMFDTDWKTGMVYNYATPFDCNGSKMSFPDTTHSPFFRQGASGGLYKATSCFGCHFQDGKGYPEIGIGKGDNNFTVATFVNLQVADSKTGLPADHPVFGASLEVKADAPYQPHGKCNITWVDGPSGTYADGTPYKLRKPAYSFSNLGYGVTSMEGVRISPRAIPHLSGMGMLEAIDESTILSFVTMAEKAGTGIVGKPQRVSDYFQGPNTLGRFGWKCGLASLKTEVYACVAADLGISSTYFSNVVPPGGTASPPKIPNAFIDTLIMYVSLLAPPPRQMGKGYIIYDPKIKDAQSGGGIWADPTLYKGDQWGENWEKIWQDTSAVRGKDLFVKAKCHLCHIPAIRTGTNSTFDELKNIEIQPFTDMLLHDMGPEEADNGYTEGIAGPSEWRTSPLWGLEYVSYVNGHTCFMHDSRARSLEEAILWHFGEGKVSRDIFLAMNAQDRKDLLRYCDYPFADRLPKNAKSPVPQAVHLTSGVARGVPALYCYPSPVRTSAVFHLVNLAASGGNDVSLKIFNMQGRAIFSAAVRPQQTMVKWDASRQAAGKYIARLAANGKVYTKDLLVIQ